MSRSNVEPEYPWNSTHVSLETFAERKMGFDIFDAHAKIMEYRQSYILACMSGFRQLVGYAHETGNVGMKFDVNLMTQDCRRPDEFELFTSNALFPYAGIFKSYGRSGFYVVLEDGTYYLSHFVFLIKSDIFLKRMKSHMKRMVKEAEKISNTADSSTIFGCRWDSVWGDQSKTGVRAKRIIAKSLSSSSTAKKWERTPQSNSNAIADSEQQEEEQNVHQLTAAIAAQSLL